jgi:Tol biopolymer transport system component
MPIAAGTRLGPYEIVTRIGTGGMSEVYRAHDPRIRRDVALKVLPATYAKYADRMHRFEQEARATGALNHPNLLTIFDTGSAEGRPYIVTELLEGHTLRHLMRDNAVTVQMSVRQTVDIATQIANGLAAAHERGIVHRDLKPENLFLTRDGRVKILDFGVAKLRTEGDWVLADDDTMEQDTSPGTVIGTVGYMSPEQVRGQTVDGRSDIFSLGTLMYEMLAGEHPFRGTSPADTMSSILREDARELTSLNPNVTPGLDRVIRHCLEKNPEQRFQSARDLAFQLDVLSSASGSMPTIETPALPSRNVRRAGGALLLLICGALLGWFLRPLRTPGTAAASFTQLTYDAGMEAAPSLAPDAKTFVFTRGGARDADIYLQRVGGRNAINLTKRCSAFDGQPAFSPDGAQIAYRSECDGGGIFVMGATGESSRRVADHCFNPSWSPDGSQLVCATESVSFTPTSRGTTSGLWVIDVESGSRRQLLSQDGVQPNWSPNGHRIAYWGIVGESAQRDLWTVDPRADDPRKTVVRVTADAAVDWNPVWSADGQYLYFGSDRNGSMNLWRIRIDEKSGRTSGRPEPVPVPARFSGHYAVARGGRHMAFASIEQTESLRAVTFDPVSGATVGESRAVVSGSFLVFSSAVSPDGRLVAVTNRGGQEDVFVVDLTTREIRQLTNDPWIDRGATWAPDASRIYFYSQRESDRYEIWSIRPDGSGLTRVTRTEGRSAWYPAVAPDGKRVSFYNDENTYVHDGTKIDALPRATEGLHPAMTSWSPDGRRLAGELRDAPGIAVYSFGDRTYQSVTNSGARPIWLPNGREIVFEDAGRLRIADVATRRVRDVVTSSPMTAISLSADARTLVFADRQTQADVWMMEVGGDSN